LIEEDKLDYAIICKQIINDKQYKRNVEFGEARPGHPEGKIKHHITDLEANLEKLKDRLPDEETYWKLKFLIHTHDIFKCEAKQGVISIDPDSHQSLARSFASKFTLDLDLLNMIQFHDENYSFWKEFVKMGVYDEKRFQDLLNTIHDWDLFLIFTIIDGNTKGKDLEKLPWFIYQVRRFKSTIVDESWTMFC
jgi:hypothetical protein